MVLDQHPVVDFVGPPLIISFVATKGIVTDGSTVDLVADFTGGTGSIDQGVGPVTSGVPITATPTASDTTVYTLTVEDGASTQETAQVSVQAVPPPVIVSFTSSASVVENGQTVDLVAIFQDGAGAMDQGIGSVTSGTPIVFEPPWNATTTVLLTVQNTADDPAYAYAAATVQAVSGGPQIVTHPLNQMAVEGQVVMLEVVAVGPPPLSYQWYKDEVIVPGGTDSVLIIDPVSSVHAGSYKATVANPIAQVESDPAILTVLSDCPVCSCEPVVVHCDVTVDFNSNPPAYCGDPVLLPYFSYDTSGPTPDTWKAIFDVGDKRLVLRCGVDIRTIGISVGCKQKSAPGIEVYSTCGLTMKRGSSIEVRSRKAAGGDILLQVGGDVSIKGCVINRASGCGGTPGKITIASKCGKICVGSRAVVQTRSDGAGSDINILGSGLGTNPQSDISIHGLVNATYRSGSPATINVASFGGQVTVDGNNLLWLDGCGWRFVTSGITVRSLMSSAAPGVINIQAAGDVSVHGNGLLHAFFGNPGAVAVETGQCSGGGTIDIRSLGGMVVAADRAIDNSNHANEFALNRLWAQGDIMLGTTGCWNWAPCCGGSNLALMPVVSAQSIGDGHGGTNELRSFSGMIQILDQNTLILAAATSPCGTWGTNLLSSCQGILNQGLVYPADLDIFDDSGLCSPPAPAPLFTSHLDFGVIWF